MKYAGFLTFVVPFQRKRISWLIYSYFGGKSLVRYFFIRYSMQLKFTQSCKAPMYVKTYVMFDLVNSSTWFHYLYNSCVKNVCNSRCIKQKDFLQTKVQQMYPLFLLQVGEFVVSLSENYFTTSHHIQHILSSTWPLICILDPRSLAPWIWYWNLLLWTQQ